MQQYTIDDLANANSLTLHIFGYKNWGTDALAVWLFASNEWATNTKITSSLDASTVATMVQGITGTSLGSSDAATGTEYLLRNDASSRSTTDDVQHCLFTISGDALTLLKNKAVDNTFTILITNRKNNMDGQRRYYSSSYATEEYRPYIVATYSNAAEMNGVGYTTLNEAINAAPTDETETTITLNHDITITSRCNSGTRNINVIPAKAGLKVTSTLNSSLWLLIQEGSTFNIGSDGYQLTIDGNNNTNSRCFVECGNKSVSTTINNIKFLNCKTAAEGLTSSIICYKNSGGSLYLKNVELDGCEVSYSGCGLIFDGLGELNIQGGLSITNCTADCDIYIENFGKTDKILKVKEMTTEPASPIRLSYKTPTLETITLSTSYKDMTSWFKVMNNGYGLAYNYENGDNLLTEAYDMTMNNYGASTLILPFEVKIPTGVKAYTLNYTAGNSSVKATEVGTNIPANTPVLLNAEAGNYKFVNTSMVDAATTGSGTHTIGALTGVYETTNVPAESYILWANATNPIGFYKANSSTVAANRAYLTADGAGVRALTIDFSGEETGINAIGNGQLTMDNAVYDLSGRRVSRPTKGLYIMNGKKVVLK